MSTRPVRSLSVAALAGIGLVAPLVGAALLGSSATAAPSAIPSVEIVGDTIVFTAAPGVDDDVIILGTEGGILNFGGVTGSSFTSKTCSDEGCDITGITRLVVYLRDGDDVVYADVPWHVPDLPFTIYGGPGNDSIGGNAGYDDELYGQSGDDWIRGYSGDDLVEGGRGNDTLRAAGGNDVVRGGLGNDLLVGRRGDDRMGGGDGADRIFGGAGKDVLKGEAGPDFLYSDDGVRDEVYGGPGRDTAKTDQRDKVSGVERLL